MKVDKVRRMQAVRKWLEKAEQSYSAHREISGEMNLIIAQAEMQRLKESDHAMERRKTWYIRGASLMAAVCIAGGISFFQGREGTETAQVAAPQVTAAEARPDPEASISPAESVLPAEPAPMEVSSPEKEWSAEAPSAPSVSAVEERSAPSVSVPVLSQEEIQSVVGEAGRTLRGQS